MPKSSSKGFPLLLGGFLFSFLAVSAQAAPPPSVQSSNEIGSDATAFKRQTRPDNLQKAPPAAVQLPAEEEAVSPGAAMKEFFVKTIRLEGVKQIRLDDLHPILAKFENQKLDLVKLRAIAKNITQYYRLRGYVTSRAFVPPQEIDNETVTIKVVEGKLGKVEVSGNKRVKSDWLLGYLRMKFGDVIQYSKLLPDLVRMNRNPDHRVQAALAPGAAPETSDLVLKVTEPPVKRFAYTFDDYGTRLSGRLRQGLLFHDSNWLGRDDEFFNAFNISERGDFVGESMNYLYPVSPSGGRFIFSYAYSQVELGKELKALNVTGGANIWSVEYVQPLVDEADWSLDFDSGFDLKEIWSDVNGDENSRDHLRVLHFGPQGLLRDAWGTTTAKNDFIFGLPDVLGAEDQQFFIDSASVSRAQQFFWDSVLLGKLEAQFSGDSLVSAEQFRAGGYDTVRGYTEGDSLGDSGCLESFEWRIPPYFLPRDFRVPGQKDTFWEALQFLGFADFAQVHLRHPAPGQSETRSLAGIGIGLRFHLTDSIQAQIDYGWPVGDTPEEGRAPRAHFSLNIPF